MAIHSSILFFFFSFFLFTNLFYWRIVDWKYCVNFYCTAKWLSYTFIYIVFHILFNYGLSQDIEYNSLCYTVCLHLLIPKLSIHPSAAPRPPWAFSLFFFLILFYFQTLQHCISFAKHQNESATGTPAFPMPGEFHEQRSLVGYSPWSCKE